MGGEGASATSNVHRKNFFRAVASVSLAILSSSLRRKMFRRAASVVLGVQFVVVLLWYHAIGSVRAESMMVMKILEGRVIESPL